MVLSAVLAVLVVAVAVVAVVVVAVGTVTRTIVMVMVVLLPCPGQPELARLLSEPPPLPARPKNVIMAVTPEVKGPQSPALCRPAILILRSSRMSFKKTHGRL